MLIHITIVVVVAAVVVDCKYIGNDPRVVMRLVNRI